MDNPGRLKRLLIRLLLGDYAFAVISLLIGDWETFTYVLPERAKESLRQAIPEALDKDWSVGKVVDRSTPAIMAIPLTTDPPFLPHGGIGSDK